MGKAVALPWKFWMNSGYMNVGWEEAPHIKMSSYKEACNFLLVGMALLHIRCHFDLPIPSVVRLQLEKREWWK